MGAFTGHKPEANGETPQFVSVKIEVLVLLSVTGAAPGTTDTLVYMPLPLKVPTMTMWVGKSRVRRAESAILLKYQYARADPCKAR